MERRAAVPLFLFFLCLYLLGGHGYLENPDSEVSYQTTRALVLRGETAIVPELGPVAQAILAFPQVVDGKQTRGYCCTPGVDGRYYSWFGIGHALWNVPFYLAGRCLSALCLEWEGAYSRQEGPYQEYAPGMKGEEYFPHLLVSLSYPLAAALTCLVLYGFALVLGFKRSTAITVTLLYGLATMAWPFGRESLSDGPATLFALLCLRETLAWHRGLRSRWALLLAGLAGAAALAIRPMLGLYLAPICLFLLIALWRRLEDTPARLGRLALFAAPLAVVGGLLLAYNQARFGRPFDFGYCEQYGRFFDYSRSLGLPMLFLSPGKGFLLFNLPLLGLLFLFGARRRPRLGESALFLALLLALALAITRTPGWHGGQGWGPRYLLPTLGPLILLTGYAWEGLRQRALPVRLALGATFLAGLLVSLGGMVSPVHGWLATSFAAAARKFPDHAAQPEIPVYYLSRYSPLHGQWRYLAANLSGGFTPGGTSGLGTRFWNDPSLDGPLPPRSRQLVRFNHLWWVDGGRRFGTLIHPALALGLLVGLVLAGLALRRSARQGDPEGGTP